MKFKIEDLDDMQRGASDSLFKEQETLVDHSRWSVLYEIVFNFMGRYYLWLYSAPATEYQDDGMYGVEEIECAEVYPTKVMVTKYLPKVT